MKFLFTAVLLVIALVCQGQATIDANGFETFEYTDGDTTYHMKKYFLCVYTRVNSKPTISEEKATLLQKAHLAHQQKMADNNKLCMAGPFGDDGDWRGILVLNVPTQEQAENLIKNDPLVKAGRSNYILKPWWGAVGTVLY